MLNIYSTDLNIKSLVSVILQYCSIQIVRAVMSLKTNDQLNVIYTITGKIFREICIQYSLAYGGNTIYIQGAFCWRHACIDGLLCLA